MVSTYPASKMAAGVQPRILPNAGGVNVLSTVSLTVALVANDLVTLLQLEAAPDNLNGFGPTIIGALLDVDKLDSNATPTIAFDIGDTITATNKLYSNVTTAEQGGYAIPNVNGVLGYQPFAAQFNTYPTASLLLDTIEAKCHTAAATFQAGNFRFLLEFTLDP